MNLLSQISVVGKLCATCTATATAIQTVTQFQLKEATRDSCTEKKNNRETQPSVPYPLQKKISQGQLQLRIMAKKQVTQKIKNFSFEDDFKPGIATCH